MSINSIGASVKTLRTKRGYTAKAMYTGLMSRANYARFEKGEIDTTAANLYELTKRLNISIDEWTRLYDQNRGRDVGGEKTMQVNQLLNTGWTTKQPEPLHQAAAICRDLYATYHYPNEHFSGLTAEALAIYLENHEDITQPNPALTEIITYLNGIETWYAKDVGLLYNVLQILPMQTLLQQVTRYLFMVKNNAWLGQGDTFLPSQPELVQQCFQPVIVQQDADTFHQLLTLFNGITMSERLIFPTLMRQIYQAFDRFTKDHDQLALDHTIDAVFTVIQPDVTPFNDQEVHQQVQLLRDWLVPKK
ncbi:helix-turn-helix domain-containing protein [Lacticaseibacillus porcinae]|uniref:helix-turn-helix domain-containing protein n=1 Tax=Lacticaseibacillus porcinae TaxID=1123687 RepID=UPI000F767C6B|nr:helix-turn-helix transcriptional regulator [Lacticaseibacillus porcinae]